MQRVIAACDNICSCIKKREAMASSMPCPSRAFSPLTTVKKIFSSLITCGSNRCNVRTPMSAQTSPTNNTLSSVMRALYTAAKIFASYKMFELFYAALLYYSANKLETTTVSEYLERFL